MPRPNRSSERTVPALRGVPAAPLLRCRAGTSAYGRIAAAQFNRQAQVKR
jgi:hypothetical protein